MQHQVGAVAASSDVLAWTKILARYREPSRVRSVTELVITIVPLVLLWVLIWAALDFGYWFGLLLAVPAAGLLVRLFMIQHDCGHGAFFRHRLANDWVGRVLGVLTLTPYDFWRRTHAIHHASSGNLDQRGIGDIDTLTVREYLALSRWGRLRYRLYRHPIVMFGIGPAYLFILQHRLPVGLMRRGWQPWLSTMATNAAIAARHRYLIWFIGIGSFLLVHLPIMLLAASVGVWLFYVQHQFEDTFWADDRTWNVHTAALHGSSHYDLPARIALVLGQYRRPPRPPPLQPNSLLSPARRAARAPRARGHGPAHPHREPALRTARAVGRKKAAPHILSRDG